MKSTQKLLSVLQNIDEFLRLLRENDQSFFCKTCGKSKPQFEKVSNVTKNQRRWKILEMALRDVPSSLQSLLVVC